MGRDERIQTMRRLEQARGSRVICFLTSDRQNAEAQIQKDVLTLFAEHLRRMGPQNKIDVLLYTSGGDTLAAFSVARLIREYSPEFNVLVPLRCHSAGTLLALGAHQIGMTKGATLSPIDPSIVGPLNPFVDMAPGQRQFLPLSVETVAGFKGLVSEDWGIKGEEALGAAFRVLAEKVHPLALGDVFRARQQIEHLARKQLAQHREDEENVLKIVRTLTRGLGSHDYYIGLSEARALFGSQVIELTGDIDSATWELYEDFALEMELRIPFDALIAVRSAQRAGQVGNATVMQRLAIVETSEGGDVAEREMVLREVQQQQFPPGMMIPGMPQAGPRIEAEVVRAGWRRYN